MFLKYILVLRYTKEYTSELLGKRRATC